MKKKNIALNTLIIVLIISTGTITYFFLMNQAERVSIANNQLKSELDKLKSSQSILHAEKLKLDTTHSDLDQKLRQMEDRR